MPRGPAPQWTKRLEPILDDHLRASIDAADGSYDPETGHYATLLYTGCATRERAKEIVRALYRSARHMKVSVSATVLPADDGSFTVQFVAIDKSFARKYVLEKYGTDRGAWPYNPRRKGASA